MTQKPTSAASNQPSPQKSPRRTGVNPLGIVLFAMFGPIPSPSPRKAPAASEQEQQ